MAGMDLFDFGLGLLAEAADPFGGRNPQEATAQKGIEDFGEKIGGARKDLWAARGLILDDIMGMNADERAKHIVKQSVWPTPDYKAIAESGVDRSVVFWMKLVRDAAPTRPISCSNPEMRQKAQENFVKVVSSLREQVMAAESFADIRSMETLLQDMGWIERPHLYGSYETVGDAELVDLNKVFKQLQRADRGLERKRAEKLFLATDEERALQGVEFYTLTGDWEVQEGYPGAGPGEKRISVPVPYGRVFLHPQGIAFSELRDGDVFFRTKGNAGVQGPFEDMDAAKAVAIAQHEWKTAADKDKRQKVRKGQLKPEILEHVDRTGPEGTTLRGERHVGGQDMLDDFGFRGGEFGNWLNEAERQANLDMSHDAFHDLALALGIRDEDVSLGGRLAIAYGARGHGTALAHFEPARDVINLTKMKGAGSLAHEWIHAWDDIVGEQLGITRSATGHMMSEAPRTHPEGGQKAPLSFRKLMDTLKWNDLEGQALKDHHVGLYEAYIEETRRDLHAISKEPSDPELAAKREELIEACVEELRTTEDYTCLVPNKRGNLKHDDAPSPAYRSFLEFQLEECSDRSPSLKGNIEWYNARRDSAMHHRMRAEKPLDRLDPAKVPTRFYADAQKLDGSYSKTGHGYWSSDCELLARAGAAWVKDRLEAQGIRDDYLCGHADRTCQVGGETVSIAPLGEERERISAAFDAVVADLCERGVFEKRRERETAEQVFDRIAATSAALGAIAASRAAPKAVR